MKILLMRVATQMLFLTVSVYHCSIYWLCSVAVWLCII